MDYQHDCMAFKMHNEDSVVYTTLVYLKRVERYRPTYMTIIINIGQNDCVP